MSDKPKHDLKDGPDLAAFAAGLKRKQRTPVQQARFEEVSERQRLMQERGVKQPKSGTWGKP